MIEFRKLSLRRIMRQEPEKIFVFGDNAKRTGFGGQAAEMRGEPNARGVATKRTPYECMKGTAGDLEVLLRDLASVAEAAQTRTIVWPSDGIGTGRAALQTQWPQGLALIEAFVECLRRMEDNT